VKPKATAQQEVVTASDLNAASPVLLLDGMMIKLHKLKTASEREQLLRQFIQTTGKLDPQSAISLMRRLPAGDIRDSAVLAILGQWTGHSSSQMANSLERVGVEGALILHLMENGQESPENAASLAKEFLRGNQRTEVLATAAYSLAASNPTAAFDLGSDLVSNQQMTFLKSFAGGWGSSDPTAAFQWANQIPDGQTRAQLQAAILESSAAKDPATAASLALTLPPADSERTNALKIAAGHWSLRDANAAQSWAQTLPDPTDRAAAQQGIQKNEIIGVGIAVLDSPDGFKVSQVIQGGAAQLNGLKPGDTILGVSDAAGGWVDAQTLPLDEMAGLIRGAPQSYVSLRIQSPTDATPRMVTLGRSKLR
jgi:hypothetical protein